jgi:poly-gamma-glutamate synthesis protein (capsule biosynthesis protein)
MTGRGIDQVLPHPGDAQIYESHARWATDYVMLAERANGPIARPVSFDYIWGDALVELDRRWPDVRIINLETAVTQSSTPEPKGINYKMSPANVGVFLAAGIDCCVLANNHEHCPHLFKPACVTQAPAETRLPLRRLLSWCALGSLA